MRINTNISSLSALRNLSATTKAFSRAMARLASGRRITSARDDAAGLAIAEGLEAQRRGMIQAVRNMNDGRGFLDTAEGALATQTGLVQRMKELAMQSANGTLSNTDRGFLNSELQQLLEEFNRITTQTSFNGVNLLDGSFGTKSFQVGTQKGQTIDVAMANMQASGVFVLRATVGTGTFQTRVTYATGVNVRRVASGDFNGDGVADLATSDNGANTLSIFLGRSDGTFQSRRTLITSGSYDVQTADLNNDGKLDLFSSGNASYLDVWLGNGNGTFASRTTAPIGSTNAWNLTYGDINGDGITDIVVSDGVSYSVDVLIGNGNGTFAVRTTIALGTNLYDARLIDINNDGKLDILSNEQNASGVVSVSLGNGDGTFAARTTVTTIWSRGISEGADLNGDGKVDFVVATNSQSRLNIFFSNGGGTLPAPTVLAAAGTTEESYLSDLNGDGYIDIISADNPINTVSVYLGNGNGTFAARTTLNNGGATLDVRTQDVNGDGVPDIISTDQTNYALNVFIANSVYQTTTPVVTIATQTAAQNMLSVFDNALTTLNSARANIGGLQNRLGYAESAANTLIENVSASKSQIMDTDFASDIAEMTRLQILQTAGVSVLSQANLSFKLVLKLLERI